MPVGLRKTNSRQSLAQTTVKASTQSKGKVHRKQRGDRSTYLRAAVVAAFLFLFLHLAFFRRTRGGSLTRCNQSSAGHVQLENLALLQQHRMQQAWLQADVDQDLKAHLHHNMSLQTPHSASSHAMTQPLILFIGIVSDSAKSRELARRGWVADVNKQQGCKAKFITQDNQTSLTQADRDLDDTLYTQNNSVLRRTLFFMQYALLHFDVQYIMKTSDDVFINVQNLVRTLQVNCTSIECSREHVYFGLEIKNTSVPLTKDGNKPESSLQYFKTTHLKTFLPYMSGIGYAVSSDLAHVLIDAEHKTKSNDFLTELNDADMTIGFWLITLDTRRIDHPGVVSCPHTGCFQMQPAATLTPARANVTSMLRPALRQPATAWNNWAVTKPIVDVCSQDWLLMHPISQEHEVEYIQTRLQQCNAVHRIQDASVTNAVKHKTIGQAHLPHGKVRFTSCSVIIPTSAYASSIGLGCQKFLHPVLLSCYTCVPSTAGHCPEQMCQSM